MTARKWRAMNDIILLKVTHRNGSCTTLNIKPPLVYGPGESMYFLQDATGTDYWFNTEDGTFDGTGKAVLDTL